jgi:anti-sigma factor RsiW
VTCREFTEFINRFLDGELPASERKPFEQHLGRCANCARYLESYRTTITLGKRAFEEGDVAVPPDVPDELVDAILRARGK